MRAALLLIPATVLLAVTGCTTVSPASSPLSRDNAAIQAALAKHIGILASDEFGGRRPGTEGEAQTLRYLAREWQAAGLESGTNDPANPWFAPVELALSLPERGTARFTAGGRAIPLAAGDAAVFTSAQRGLVERAPVVFVGTAGGQLDRSVLAGRVAVMLWDHEGQVEQRNALLSAGASAVLAVVMDERELAGLTANRRRGSYRLGGADDGGAIDGYLSRAAMSTLVGQERWAALLRAAGEDDFRPTPLNLSATLEATSIPGTVRTYNLVARLPGRRSSAGAVLVLGHWDHFGTCAEPPATDLICNGAVDNASGLAVMTELARRLAAGPRLERDVYFLATTAEEWGLLGAQAFAENPPIPLDTIVAAFNLDTVAVAPAGSPVAIVGKGLTRLDPGILQVIAQMGRSESDERLAQDYVRRQDGWALLQRDVPAVSVTSAFALPGPLGRYTAEHYHQPSDEPAGVELGGAADDLLLTAALVRHFADPARWPGVAGKTPAAP
ncbi:M20/M25/M40 family metallo-hydrolase [Altererythrobacter sp. TH136]|uniref:M28 family peptidase n=1 Tax=Altererythrobacter sp. TH136 TaxID=2067415 RepID=UPI0011628501|nr:M20/M25/M40 family metallo-hydrolase [Altererythrobacter sp. TH136]QDM40139.1 M28 family peptidase [Altererythrobacter sp. TH136]